jgi:hypothetical protein
MSEIITGFLAISGAVFWLLALAGPPGFVIRRVRYIEVDAAAFAALEKRVEALEAK